LKSISPRHEESVGTFLNPIWPGYICIDPWSESKVLKQKVFIEPGTWWNFSVSLDYNK
jgi:hypothetical protein